MEERVEKAKLSFKNHEAKLVVDNDDITVIDWRNKSGSSNYYVRYIISKNYCGSIIVTGDLGDAVIETYWNKSDLSIKEIARLIPERNMHYLHGKMRTDNDKYDCDPYVAEEKLREQLQECDLEADEDPEEIIESCMHYWNTDVFESGVVDVFSEYDQDCWEWIFRCGKKLSTRFVLWITGLVMACRQICEVE